MARTTAILFLALFAGAVGGIAASLVTGGGDPGADSKASAPAPPSDAAALREEVAGLREEVTRLHQDLARLTAESAENAARAEKEEVRVLQPETPPSPFAPGQPGTFRLGNGRGGRVVSLGRGTFRLGGPGGKTAELMKLTEEERWTKMREDLCLDSYQETELKQIRKDLKAEMRGMLEVDPDTGMPGRLDLAKMMEARSKANERVNNLLSEQQRKDFREKGYAGALGFGGPTYSVVSISTSTDEGK